jgi:tetratricopeptide (TPR) repeat protein
VARALKVALVPSELEGIEKKPTMNMQAYNYYLQGREYYIGLESAELRESLQLAANMFEKAIEADSNFALAYAGLSDCYCYPVMHGIDPKRSWLDQAERSVLKALALDPNLGEARRALSRLYFTKGETEKAIQEAEETVRANPTYGTGWRTLGDSWLYSGRYLKAESALMKALEVNPTDRSLFCSIIDLYSLWGDRNKAEDYFRRGLEVQPRNANIYNFGSRWCMRSGKLEEAKRRAYKGLNTNPHSSFNMENLMWIFMMSGKEDSSSFYLNEVHRENPEADCFVELAYLALMRGNKERAAVYADSCVQFNEPLIREFEGMPYEYWSRLRIALAYALRGESRKALEQAESVRRSLGESLLSVEWAAGRGIVPRLSLVYSLTGQKDEAMRMLDFLVKINYCSPAYIRLHPWFKNLSGYPPFEALIGRKTD